MYITIPIFSIHVFGSDIWSISQVGKQKRSAITHVYNTSQSRC